MKKTVSTVLALALMVGLSSGATAVDPTQTVTGKEPGTSTSAEADLPLVGTVKNNAILISVVMPASVDFVVSTKAADNTVAQIGVNSATESGSAFDALLAPSNAVITNNSNRAIDVDITAVTDTNGLLDKVKLALATGNTSLATAMETPLTTAASEDSPIHLARGIGAKAAPVSLRLYGSGLIGTLTGDDATQYPVDVPSGGYTVTTTLKVSIADNNS